MKKISYYYINEKSEKVSARKSHNDYKYALIYKNEYCIKCSSKLELVQQELNYRTKGYGHNMKEKINGRYLYSDQFCNPKDFNIVQLIKEF